MPIEKTNLFNRVQEALCARNAAEVSKKLGITQQAITRWKQDGGISIQTLILVHDQSGVSTHWILTGKGSKFVSGASDDSYTGIKLLAPGQPSEDTVSRSLTSAVANFATLAIPLIGAIQSHHQRLVVFEEQELVKVPLVLTTEDSLLLQIEGNDLAGEGLHHGDVLIVETASDSADQRIVVAKIPGDRFIVRHHTRVGRVAHFAPIEGDAPVIRFPARDVEIQYVVTSITRRH